MQLFPDQVKAKADIRAAYRAGANHVLFVAPTGMGKTVLFANITAGVAGKGKRVTLLAHRQELVDQISAALREFRVPHGRIAPGEAVTGHPIQVASSMTLIRRLARYATPDLVIADEAHHALPSTTVGKIIAHYGTRSLGVTATPLRLDGSGLGQLFDRLVCGPTTAELIALGRLCPLQVYAPPGITTVGLHSRMGDFVRDELLAVVDKPKIVGDAVSHYRRLAAGKRAVVFCVSVDHAKRVAAEFMSAGFPALSIDGTTDKGLRREIIKDFQKGTIRLLASCDLISEGFDCPGIEVGISLRPTQSVALWRQQVGRCLRAHPGKDRALILDHSGNSIRLGVPGLSPDPEWSLDGADKVANADRAVGIRVCPKCFAAGKSGSARCGSCGYAAPVDSRAVGSIDGELQPVDATALAARFATERKGAATLEALIDLGKRRGMKNPEGWARHVVEARKSKQSRRAYG